ncbi:MAG: ATP-binding cassette domain-containing protein [Chloroflexota bacterium]
MTSTHNPETLTTSDHVPWRTKEDSDPRPTPVARLSNVVARADGSVQLDHLDLEINPGEIHALLGPGGAGRSLVLHLLLGLVDPSDGEVTVLDLPPADHEARERVGGAPYETRFPSMLRVGEIVEFVSAHYRDVSTVRDFLDKSGLQPYMGKTIAEISRSEERWLAVMLAFAGNPDLVILDHPTRGMDMQWKVKLWQVLRSFAESGGSVLISTEASEEVESAADRVTVMCDGSIIITGTPDEVIEFAGRRKVTAPQDQLQNVDVSDGIAIENRAALIPTSDPDQIIHQLTDAGVGADQIQVGDSNLEQSVLYLLQCAQR